MISTLMALHIIDCISNYWALTLLAPIRRKNFFFRLSSPRSAPSQLLAEWTCNNVIFFKYLVHVLSFRKHITFFHNRQSCIKGLTLSWYHNLNLIAKSYILQGWIFWSMTQQIWFLTKIYTHRIRFLYPTWINSRWILLLPSEIT